MTRPKVKFFTLCDQVIEDKETGKYSLIGLMDAYLSPAFPTMGNMSGMALLLGEPNQSYRYRLEIKNPKDTGKSPELQRHLSDNGTGTLRLDLSPVPFPCPGTYSIRLFIDGELAEESFFDVNQADILGSN